ncbi:hypothetical protein LLG96_01935 [bacterium]|nr:hypothetical protein [bacterium]
MKKNLSFCALFIVIWVLSYAGHGFTAARSNTVTLDAAGIERDARLINLIFDRPGNAIMLDDTELIEDDGPATGMPEGFVHRDIEWQESLKKGIVIKKLLVLDNPKAYSGRLLFKGIETKGNSEPLHISLNGVEFVRPATRFAYPFAREYIDLGWDRWFYIDLPVGALKSGTNEVLMWADSDSTSWIVFIAIEQEFARGSLVRTHHPNRSMKSSDGGRTWSDSKLGTKDTVDGEYSVRISLDRHVRAGEYISPVYDLIENESVLKHKGDIKNIRITVDTEVPDSTSAAVLTRFGGSPLTGDPSWSEWRRTDPGQDITASGNRRYFQWKAELATLDPLKSPSIRSVAINTEWEDRSPNSSVGVDARVVHNGHVVRSSYPFTYENLLHPGLKEYYKNHKLDRIVEGATSEFEVMMRLLNWAYRIPLTSEPYSWDWNKVTIIEKGEKGMPRLQGQYDGRRRDAMCLYSNQALIGALLSLGYEARHINIHSEGVSGHEVTEVWSNEFNKWVYMDATRDYYYYDSKTGVPYNLLEIHNLLAAELPRVETWQRPFVFDMGTEVVDRIDIGMREGNNPVSIVEHGRHIMEIMGHFRIIPRNDFLSNPLPVPVHTGDTMWGWSGFLNWYDDMFPKRTEYQMYTNRAIDFYEPLNQAEIFLSETDDRGLLKVEVETFTPGGFDTFLVRTNDGQWVGQKEPSWLWNLRSGLNRIDVRTRNVREVLGPVSTILVTYNP